VNKGKKKGWSYDVPALLLALKPTMRKLASGSWGADLYALALQAAPPLLGAHAHVTARTAILRVTAQVYALAGAGGFSRLAALRGQTLAILTGGPLRALRILMALARFWLSPSYRGNGSQRSPEDRTPE